MEDYGRVSPQRLLNREGLGFGVGSRCGVWDPGVDSSAECTKYVEPGMNWEVVPLSLKPLGH